MASNRLVDLNAVTSDDYDEDMEREDTVEKPETQKLVEKYQPTKRKLDKMQSNIDKITEREKKVFSTVGDEKQKIVDEINTIISETSTIANAIKKELKDRKQENVALAINQAGKSGTIQMANNLYVNNLRNFVTLMSEYKVIVQKYQTKCHQHSRRQIKIHCKQLDDEQVEKIVNSGKAQVFLQERRFNRDVEDILQDLEARNEGILSLEMQVKEVFQMFQDLAQLVDAADERIAIIECHVADAKASAEHAEEELHQAIIYQRKTHKRRFLALIIVMVLALIIVASIAGSVS